MLIIISIKLRPIMAEATVFSMSTLLGSDDLARFIARNYSGRVVEVGVGYFPDVALALMERGLDVKLTDKEERLLGGLLVEKDDIFSPRMELYGGAGLLYSIRPPLEMQLAMGQIAMRIRADVLVRPLMDEVADLPGFSKRLINSGKASFYLFKKL